VQVQKLLLAARGIALKHYELGDIFPSSLFSTHGVSRAYPLPFCFLRNLGHMLALEP
jgi:hypothetical protein